MCSLQCPALKIILTVSFRPLSFFQHTSYVSHIKQPIKCDCLFLFDCRFCNHSLSQARWTAKHKRQWKRSLKYYQIPINFVRSSSADLRRISIRLSAGQSFICGALFHCMHRAPFHWQLTWRGNCEKLPNMNMEISPPSNMDWWTTC